MRKRITEDKKKETLLIEFIAESSADMNFLNRLRYAMKDGTWTMMLPMKFERRRRRLTIALPLYSQKTVHRRETEKAAAAIQRTKDEAERWEAEQKRINSPG